MKTKIEAWLLAKKFTGLVDGQGDFYTSILYIPMSKLKNAIEYACTITKLSLHISTASPASSRALGRGDMRKTC